MINISSIVLTLFLLYEDFHLFLTKPTYSSISNRKLQPVHFPEITLCPFPSFDEDQLGKSLFTNIFKDSNISLSIGCPPKNWDKIYDLET